MQNYKSKFKIIKKIKRNVPLARYTTFRIGGSAKYFVDVKNNQDLIEAIGFVKEKGLPFFILGGGSNLLVSDRGFEGLVIKIKNQKVPLIHTVKIKITNQNPKIIEAEAGVKLEDLVKLAARNSLTGLEWAAGIPGTVGGAIYGNAAAFGGSMEDVVEEVECAEVEPLREVRPPKIRIFKNKDCQFGYKETIFNKNKNLIILSCLLKLKKGNGEEIKKKINYHLDYREKNHPMEFPSAGCIFENPQKIKAGELIEKCGLKGKRIGDAQISPRHVNFIVNLGDAKARDVLRLINLIKKKVKEKFGIKLKEEIQYLGF